MINRDMFSRLINGLIDLIYPKLCLVCKNKLEENQGIDNLVCRQCWNKIKKNLPPFCSHCGRHLQISRAVKNTCMECLKNPSHFDRAFSPCLYEGPLKELIHKFKYEDKPYLGRPLSRLLVDFIKEYGLPMEDVDFIVPVPLHKARLREREFNQAQILSDYLGMEFKKKILSDNLIRQRYTKTQTELEPKQRWINVKGSFSVKDSSIVKGKNILLIDDVITSKTTASEAAGALKDAGAGVVFVLTLAN